MKKIFTLIAVALATMSVNAQTETYTAITRDAETKVMTLSDEFKAVLPLNEDGSYGDVATNKDERGSVVVMKTASVTVEAVGGSTPADVPDVAGDNTMTHVDINPDGTVNSWSDIKWQQKNQGDINWAWIQGTGNPAAKIEAEAIMTDDVPATYVDENGVEHTKYRPLYTFYNPDGSLGVPEMGLYYKFTATTAGSIKIGTWVNKGNRKTYVVDAATALPVAYKAEGYINGQNHKILPEGATDSVSVKKYLSTEEIDSIHKANCTDATTGEDTKPYVIGAGNQPFFGYITFEMEAGKTYYVFCESTQLGFNGWEFTPAPAAGPEIPANAIYFWESPDGTPVEKGGKIEYMNGDGDRLNYANAGYYTICLNGKKANINDDAPSANAGHMLLTLDQALEVGDVIEITAYRNKNADGKNASIMFYFENGAEWADTKSFVNILSDDENADWDNDGSTPNTNTWEITAAEAGSKTIKMTRNSASTNLFITKFVITRGGASGIENVEVVTPVKNNAIYNLSGQKVDASYKGIIIVNGKKFFNK